MTGGPLLPKSMSCDQIRQSRVAWVQPSTYIHSRYACVLYRIAEKVTLSACLFDVGVGVRCFGPLKTLEIRAPRRFLLQQLRRITSFS